MIKINVGDKVIFNKYGDSYTGHEVGLLTWFGVIARVNTDGTYNIIHFDDYRMNMTVNVKRTNILPISQVEHEREDITKRYNFLINEEKNKLRTVSDEEKDKDKLERYESIKQRIIRNCERLIDMDLDDEDFVNRVKEIANLKKQLFSPDRLPCMNEIHKHNGTIKYNIRQLETERNRVLSRISDEEIEKKLKDF